ncbi:MAG: prephenate dehydrogenase [Isosphaeraceae bacterium]|jgi:prephenate dehydrogenase|nr:MAG: prephenate dehydrogenase [Isosphaeraceae bacterium]
MIVRSATIVGVGLIGGSLGLALKARGLVERVIGLGRDPERLELARRRGAIDRAVLDPAAAFGDSDLAVICTPVSQIVEQACLAGAHGPAHLVVTDVGSTKRGIVADLEREPSLRGRFVGAHPIAGSERSGVEHADGDLFQGAPCVITPGDSASDQAVQQVAALWHSVGSRVRIMAPAEHDRALTLVSHLPHALAAALVHLVDAEDASLAGGAYRDVSRIAASDEAVWTDIFLANREAMLDALARFSDQLAEFRRLLDRADRRGLSQWWRTAQMRRRDWSPGPDRESSPRPPAGIPASGADPR